MCAHHRKQSLAPACVPGEAPFGCKRQSACSIYTETTGFAAWVLKYVAREDNNVMVKIVHLHLLGVVAPQQWPIVV